MAKINCSLNKNPQKNYFVTPIGTLINTNSAHKIRRLDVEPPGTQKIGELWTVCKEVLKKDDFIFQYQFSCLSFRLDPKTFILIDVPILMLVVKAMYFVPKVGVQII